MLRWPAVACGLLAGVTLACGPTADVDRDGLDDARESALAVAHFPVVHEYAEGGDSDACPQPRQRPVLYRARPRQSAGIPDLDTVAITYVLLYAEDCGPLGHAGDSEAFTVFVQKSPGNALWRTVGAIAMAHQGSPAEKTSVGTGREIWVSRNKHANFATFQACGDSDIPGDICAETGPPAPIHAFLNAGEPGAPMSRDVGDVLLEAGVRLNRVAGRNARSDEETRHAYFLFRDQRIWEYVPFLGAGDLTSQLILDRSLTAPLVWEAESRRVRKDSDR
jgi:hypothetical protein